ncbi:MAG: hypothetical protein AUG49_24600 [Catenulispora sp. 13_1_20CM_3_70_7]|nr:MAG: hypothetical protein AUG49_24600 [Catenulispora sp. 13_1_20CM_3_70_7]
MSTTSTGGGGVLPSYDPWDGDPAEYDAFATKLGAREAHTTEIRIGIVSLARDPSLTRWLGKSADAFRATLEPLPNLLEQMADVYNQAATAVRSYAQALRDGQASFAKTQSSLQAQVLANPANAGGRGGAAALLASHADQASQDHDKAKQACVRELAEADDHLRLVKAALADRRFADFTETFTSFHGDIADLAGLQYAGADLFSGQLDALRATIGGGAGALTPEQFRAEIQDMINQYGDNSDFWLGFGPLLGQIPGYLDQHDKQPDGSLTPEDQALLAQLGQATAKAASVGKLNFLITTTNGTDLAGLTRIVAAAGGGRAFGSGPGAQFLADLVTKMTDLAANSAGDPHYSGFCNAVSQALQAATQDGEQLVTQLLRGSTALKQLMGTLGGTYAIDFPPSFPDAAAIAAFLNAGVMASRGTGPTALQQIQAALNVVRAGAAFGSWNPSDKEHIDTVGELPASIGSALRNYATANMFDLAQSTANSSTQGVTWRDNIPGNPYIFMVSNADAQAFLKVALQDPHDAMAYQALVAKKYTESVRDAIRFGPLNDFTPAYANLISSTQLLIDLHRVSEAQQIDARNANHLLIVNMIGGAFGNAPGPDTLGLAQSIEGLMQPAIGGGSGFIGRFFDTSHAAQAQAANHVADIGLVDFARLLAAQGAYDAGALAVVTHEPDAAHPLPSGVIPIGPDVVDASGKIQNTAAFQSWWITGQNPVLGQSGQPLSHYVDQIQNAMAIHS